MKANTEQESAGWALDRCGAFTASRSGDLMAKTRSGPSASRGALLTLLAVERITGQPVETYTNAAMQRGTELEAEARDAYAFDTGTVVDEVGFVAHPTIPHCGCSPDGLIGTDGLLEVKCPANMAKHLDALRTGAHAVEYRWQLQHQLMVTGRKWVDAASYHPSFPVGLQVSICRVHRDEKAIAELVAAIEEAELEVQETVNEMVDIMEKNRGNR